jgi:hypothetical protein
MVDHLFADQKPNSDDSVFLPGVGTAQLASAVNRYSDSENRDLPKLLGVESDFELISESRDIYKEENIDVRYADFLAPEHDFGTHKFILGNPPYVPIGDLTQNEKERYRKNFETAEGRFNLYILFFERALSLLEEGGRLVFITPEKFEYVRSARTLRSILSNHHVVEISHISEGAFEGLTTYPTVTVVEKNTGSCTCIQTREGESRKVNLPKDGQSWANTIRNVKELEIDSDIQLGDICQRISPGAATGADRIFVQQQEEVPDQLDSWTYPTISGRQLNLNDGADTNQVFVCPYLQGEGLAEESALGPLIYWLEIRREQLEDRSCVKKYDRKWYGWHENPPLEDILQSKIIFQDVTDNPRFWWDESGTILPRHSVYYFIPKSGVDVDQLLNYLNSDNVKRWCLNNCQKASNGYIRLQSRVIENLPVPRSI